MLANFDIETSGYSRNTLEAAHEIDQLFIASITQSVNARGFASVESELKYLNGNAVFDDSKVNNVELVYYGEDDPENSWIHNILLSSGLGVRDMECLGRTQDGMVCMSEVVKIKAGLIAFITNYLISFSSD
jgi:hypothetical protein